MVNEWIEWVELHISNLETRVKKLEEKNAKSQKDEETPEGQRQT